MHKAPHTDAKSRIFSSYRFRKISPSPRWMMKNHYHLQTYFWWCDTYRIRQRDRMCCFWFWEYARYISEYVNQTKGIPGNKTRGLENQRWNRNHAWWMAWYINIYWDRMMKWRNSQKIYRTSRIFVWWRDILSSRPDISSRTRYSYKNIERTYPNYYFW